MLFIIGYGFSEALIVRYPGLPACSVLELLVRCIEVSDIDLLAFLGERNKTVAPGTIDLDQQFRYLF